MIVKTRVYSLMYHDVVDGDDDASGFPGPGAAIYKLDRATFALHLASLDRALAGGRPETCDDLEGRWNTPEAGTKPRPPVLLTFDDGGSSAYTMIAGMLESRGWRGHFFVTTGRIGSPGFLLPGQIRELDARGHLVGSHSHTHPTRMARCFPAQMTEEWSKSTCILGEILGRRVEIASVPGGYYSRAVAEAAAACGVRALFNSEPVSRPGSVNGCAVLGRYTIQRQTPPGEAAALATGRLLPCLRHSAAWNARKVAKAVGGTGYLKFREFLLKQRA